jgi:hypothetical protein
LKFYNFEEEAIKMNEAVNEEITKNSESNTDSVKTRFSPVFSLRIILLTPAAAGKILHYDLPKLYANTPKP